MIDLSDVRVVDNHVHPWRQSTQHVTAEELAGHLAFSDGALTSVRNEYLPLAELEGTLRLFRGTNLGVSYLLRELAHLFDVDETWPAVVEARNTVAGADYRAWTTRLFDDVGLSTLLVDEGGSRPRITLDELSQSVPVRLRRVARSDNFVRDLLPEADSWSTLFQKYQESVEAAIDDGAIAFKSVIAYRTGLDVQPVWPNPNIRVMKCKVEAVRAAKLTPWARSWLQWVFCKLLTARRSRTSHGIVAGRASDRGRNRCPDRRRGLPAQFSGSPRPNLPPQFALHDADVGIGPFSRSLIDGGRVHFAF